jgi:hypothetical protein
VRCEERDKSGSLPRRCSIVAIHASVVVLPSISSYIAYLFQIRRILLHIKHMHLDSFLLTSISVQLFMHASPAHFFPSSILLYSTLGPSAVTQSSLERRPPLPRGA